MPEEGKAGFGLKVSCDDTDDGIFDDSIIVLDYSHSI